MNLENYVSKITIDSPVCVVTGGTSGIGNATVGLFNESGYRIATCGRDLERLSQLRSGILADENHNLIANTDLTDPKQRQNFTDEIISKFDTVDVLVNNAAAAPLGPFSELTSETFEDTLSLNIQSVFYLTQVVWRKMIEQGRGVIVNISSLAAVDPFPGFSIYGASKAWMDLMTRALAIEGKDNGIRVCSIRAGAVETPLLRNLFPDFPADQCVSPRAIADSVYACVHEPENYPSGQHFVVTNQP